MTDKPMDSALLAVLFYIQVTLCATLGALIWAWSDGNPYPAMNVAGMTFAAFVSVAPFAVLTIAVVIDTTRS